MMWAGLKCIEVENWDCYLFWKILQSFVFTHLIDFYLLEKNSQDSIRVGSALKKIVVFLYHHKAIRLLVHSCLTLISLSRILCLFFKKLKIAMFFGTDLILQIVYTRWQVTKNNEIAKYALHCIEWTSLAVIKRTKYPKD